MKRLVCAALLAGALLPAFAQAPPAWPARPVIIAKRVGEHTGEFE